jgi:hypothetical protein
MTNVGKHERKKLLEALKHLRAAIELLDACAAPGQIAARVDHAASEIDDVISDSTRSPRTDTHTEALARAEHVELTTVWPRLAVHAPSKPTSEASSVLR